MASSGRNRPDWIRHSGVGVEFAAAVAGFTAVGYWIDRRYGSAPWGLIIGAALGLIGGSYNLVRASLKAFKELDNEELDKEHRGKQDQDSESNEDQRSGHE